jgi:hypothetical protein
MNRQLGSLVVSLLMASPIVAGEMDKEFASKPARSTPALASAATPLRTEAVKTTEMDAEGPAQAWGHHGGYGHGSAVVTAGTVVGTAALVATATIAGTADSDSGSTASAWGSAASVTADWAMVGMDTGASVTADSAGWDTAGMVGSDTADTAGWAMVGSDTAGWAMVGSDSAGMVATGIRK